MGASTSIKTENKRACGGNTPWRTRDPIQPPCRHHARHLRSVPFSDSKTSDLLSSHGESQLHTVEDGCRTNVDCFRILVAGLGILALFNGQERRRVRLKKLFPSSLIVFAITSGLISTDMICVTSL